MINHAIIQLHAVSGLMAVRYIATVIVGLVMISGVSHDAHAALQPAENLKVKIDEKNKTADITVPEDQLSLAIGREGQNVRLAAKLTGYKINLKGPKGAEMSATKDDLEYEIDKLEFSSRVRNALIQAEKTNLKDLKAMTSLELKNTKGLGPKTVQEIQEKLEELI